MREFASMVKVREPMVDDIIGFMDSVSFPAKCTNECVEQTATYCGYECNTMVNNVFAYGPDGKVFFAAINFLGSWADRSLTARFMHQMKSKIGNYKICIHQEFPQISEAYGTLLVGPITKRAVQCLHCDMRNYLFCNSSPHTSLQQASEWGMRGMQGTFPRCKKRLPSDLALCCLVTKAIVLVHNFGTNYVGYSKIQTEFLPEYVQVKHLQGCSQIAQYYVRPGNYNSKVDGDGSGSDGKSDKDKSIVSYDLLVIFV
jgi:hypothetical protein